MPNRNHGDHKHKKELTAVSSPYNFVPAPEDGEQVNTPIWAHQVSHDIPFENGESGELSIKIEAKTDIFVRNSQLKNQEDNSFFHYLEDRKMKFMIPGSSLRGMLRSVVEIISRSRLNPDLVDNHRYGHRDLSNNSLYMKSIDLNKIQAGWLSISEGTWSIAPCGKPIKIHHSEVDKVLGTSFRDSFLNTDPKDKSAKYKYKQVPQQSSLRSTFSIITSDKTSKAVQDPDGEAGIIIFTGQSSKRSEERGKPSGKVHEFVFFEPAPAAEASPIVLTDEQVTDFKFLYSDGLTDESVDWKYWKSTTKEEQRIPIFYTPSGKDSIKHMGLAYMYKLPYKKSIHETAPISSYYESLAKPDFAELLFGNIRGQGSGLKGRVFVGHAAANGSPIECQEVTGVLAGPKASFFPFYLQQTAGKLRTFDDDDAILSGSKRYPVQKSAQRTDDNYLATYEQSVKDNKDVQTSLTPLKAGTTFEGKIRYHNLKPEELGALLSAITFHGQTDCYHIVGAAKAFGYGRVAITVDEIKKPSYLDDATSKDVSYYLKQFEAYMTTIDQEWGQSTYMKELIAMAQLSPEAEGSLAYMQLSSFAKVKKEKQHLRPYTEIAGKSDIAYSQYLSGELQQELQRAKTEIRALEEQIGIYEKEKNYEKALELCELLETMGAESQQSRVEQINEEITKRNAAIAFEARKSELLKSDDIAAVSTFYQEHEYAVGMEAIKRHLAELKAQAGMPPYLEKAGDFNGFAKAADKWLKKLDTRQVPDQYIYAFAENISRLYTLEKDKRKLSSNWISMSSCSWKRVEGWLPTSTMKDLADKHTIPDDAS